MFTKIIKTTALTLALATILTITSRASGVNWGLSYPTPGQSPKGTASAAELAEHNAYFIGNSSDKVIYLTFDAGYEDGLTGGILDTLKKTQTPAAFFLVGSYINSHPELIKRMIDEGHIVANHTMTHPDMSTISDKQSFQKELEEVEALYKSVTGQVMPKLYRPPRGIYSTENLKLAKELGYKTVFWSLAYVDWLKDKQPSRDEAFDKLIPRAHNGMVLLLHSTSKTNAAILEELINKYKEMGFEFKSLNDLMA